MTRRQYATFEVDDQLFGVDVTCVQEVLSFPRYTPVPLAPAAVGGLFNLRGQVIAAVDLRVRLGLPAREREGLAMNVIVWDGQEAVSLLVDRIGEVIERDDEDSEPPPDTLTGPVRDLVLRTFTLPDRLLLALDAALAADPSATDRPRS
jgi:purine-binding chemotaxis protein CheW